MGIFRFLEDDVASPADRMRKFRQASSSSRPWGVRELSWERAGLQSRQARGGSSVLAMSGLFWSQPSCFWTSEALVWQRGVSAWQP